MDIPGKAEFSQNPLGSKEGGCQHSPPLYEREYASCAGRFLCFVRAGFPFAFPWGFCCGALRVLFGACEHLLVL